MNTYLEEHSATDFVTYLKEKMRRKEEKVKSGEQEENTKKERKDDDEKRRMRRRGKIMMNEDEARESLVRSQEAGATYLLPAPAQEKPGGEKGDKAHHLLLPPTTTTTIATSTTTISTTATTAPEELLPRLLPAAGPGDPLSEPGQGDPGRPPHTSLPGGGAVRPQGGVHQGSGKTGLTCSTPGVLYSCTGASLCEVISPHPRCPPTCTGSYGDERESRLLTCKTLSPYSPLPAPSYTTRPPTPNLASPPITPAILLTSRGAGGGERGGRR